MQQRERGPARLGVVWLAWADPPGGSILRIVILLAMLGCGCSAILAASGDPDLSKVHSGATRREVETEVGFANKSEKTEAGSRAMYRIAIGDPADSDRALENALSPLDTIDTLTTGDSSGISFLWAIPGAIIVEGVHTVKEIGRHSAAETNYLEVTYDQEGRVVSHTVSTEPPAWCAGPTPRHETPPPAPAGGTPSDAEIARQWREAKRNSRH